jgi:myo-inositol 2-dehydrogenase / D-chiro-inositol 1-dehydrogenase
MATPFRYGIIGTGMMGMEHIANIAHIDHAQVTAFADPHPASRLAAAEACPEATAFDRVGDLLDSGLCDAVVIATPNFTHVDVLLAAVPTDLHILIEKPLCTTVEDCRRVIQAASGRTAITWVGLEYRYMPPVARLRQEVRRGTIGSLKMLSIREHRFPFLPKVDDWNRFNRNTGGTLVEKCCHYFDLMNDIVGTPAVRVMASGSQAVNHLDEEYGGERPDILDNAYVIVEYEGGARAMLDLCMFAEATRDQEELVAVGDRGKVEALIPSMELRIGRRGEHFIGSVEIEPIEDPRIRFQGFHHGSSYLEHLDFIEACQRGGSPEVSLTDGLNSVAIGVAAQQSIETGLPVTMTSVLG